MNNETLDYILEYLNNVDESENIIDTIDFDSDNYLNESNIDKLDLKGTKGTCQIVVLPNEGINYPHFHIGYMESYSADKKPE